MHTLHVVHVGLMGNIHFLEILDFLLGWFGYDISGDDTASLAKAQGSLEPPEPPPPKETQKKPPKRSRRDPNRFNVGPLDAQP